MHIQEPNVCEKCVLGDDDCLDKPNGIEFTTELLPGTPQIELQLDFCRETNKQYRCYCLLEGSKFNND